jgi:hypothetical protein
MQAVETSRDVSAVRSRRMMGFLLGALLALPAQSDAQGLADAAAREKERRKEVGRSTRALTERDLAVGRPAPSAPAVPPAAAVPRVAAPASEPVDEPERLSEEEEREDRLQAWRQMMQIAREDVARLSTEVDQVKASLGGLSGLYGSARGERMALLEKANQDLAASRRTVETLEDAGRRHGYR